LEKIMPVCNHCLQEKDESEFNWRFKALGIGIQLAETASTLTTKNTMKGTLRNVTCKK
jgi:hypothetical protein